MNILTQYSQLCGKTVETSGRSRKLGAAFIITTDKSVLMTPYSGDGDSLVMSKEQVMKVIEGNDEFRKELENQGVAV